MKRGKNNKKNTIKGTGVNLTSQAVLVAAPKFLEKTTDHNDKNQHICY